MITLFEAFAACGAASANQTAHARLATEEPAIERNLLKPDVMSVFPLLWLMVREVSAFLVGR